MPEHEIGTGPGVKSVGTDSGRGKRTAVSNPSNGGFGADGGVKMRGGAGGSPSTPSGKPATRQSESGAPSTGSGVAGVGPGDGGGVKSVPKDVGGRGSPGAPPASARTLQPVGGTPTAQSDRTLTRREQQPSLDGRNQAEDANAAGLDNRSPQPFGAA